MKIGDEVNRPGTGQISVPAGLWEKILVLVAASKMMVESFGPEMFGPERALKKALDDLFGEVP